MRAVKLKLYQNLVNFRRELNFKYVQTYPLPTPSMVKGMAHYILGLRQYEDLRIAIQGKHESIITNIQKVYKFAGTDKAQLPSSPYRTSINGTVHAINTSVLFIDLIVNLELVLHISFKDEALNDKLLEAVTKETITLGRHEDISRLDSASMVTFSESEVEDDINLDKSILLSKETANRLETSGTSYRLPFYYKPVENFQQKRIFKYVDCVFVEKGKMLETEDKNLMVDSEGCFVDFLEISDD